MSRPKPLAIAVSLAAAAALLGAFASTMAASQKPSAGSAGRASSVCRQGALKDCVLAFIAVQTSAHFLGDINRPPVPGDRLLFTDKLLAAPGTAQKGARVGRDFGDCTAVVSTRFLCGIELRLPGRGLLEFQGTLPGFGPATTSTVPLIGGAGAFATARGFAQERPIGNKTTIVVHLL